jgi:phospholipid/cholesterol/gamma-HCH transport system permease protein
MPLMGFVSIQKNIEELLALVGRAASNFAQITYAIAWGRFNIASFFKEANIFVYGVIIPVMVISIALGVVIGVQLGPEFVSKGIGSKLGILSALTMTRELIPVVGSLMIATQYGTGLAAELANMQITEQIDALKVFKVNHLEYLIVPKFLAAVIFSPIIIWLASIVAVASSYITVWLTEDLSFKGFMGSIWSYIKISDVTLCLIKSAVFAALIILIATTLGLNVKGGAKEVGKATTMTVILSFVAIVAVDFVITSIYL